MKQKLFTGIIILSLMLSSISIAPQSVTQKNIQSYLLNLTTEEPDSIINVIIRKQGNSNDAEDLISALGGIVHDQFELIHSFSATIPVKAISELSKLDSVQWVSIDGPVRSTSTDVENMLTISDNFTNVSFDNSDSAPLWINSWQEIGESDGASSGDLMVVDFWGGALSGVRFQGANRGIERAIALSDASTAQMTLAYRRKDFASDTDQVQIQASRDDGASWITLEQLGGPASDAEIKFATYDLTSVVGTTSKIRFITSDSFSADARFYLDFVEVQMTAKAGSTPVNQLYLPLVAGGETTEVTVEAAASVNTSALTNAYIKEIRADDVWNAWIGGRQGAGVTVAVVDSGISLSNDLKTGWQSRILASVQFGAVSGSPDDDFGHGTHVAGIIAGNGAKSGGQFIGVAPKANLIDVKVTNDFGNGSTSDVVAGIQWIYNNRKAYNIKVANLSLNSSIPESYHESALNAALEILWFSNIVVVVSSGNDGGEKLYAPANDPFVITVGAVDDRNTETPSDDQVPSYSAFAVTQDGIVKPDIMAPGDKIISLLSGDDSTLKKLFPAKVVKAKNGTQHMQMSGTSMASAVVAGAVALLLEDEPYLSPDQVKYRLMSTAYTLGGKENCMTGTGILDIYAAVNSFTLGSANTGLLGSELLWTGTNPLAWSSVNWNSVNWNSVNWNSVNWNSVNWNSINWNSNNWDLTNSSSSNSKGSSNKNASCNGGIDGNAVTYFTLVNADRNQDIMALSDQTILDLAKLPTSNLSIRANTRGSVNSVQFNLDNGQFTRVDSVQAFSLYGDVLGVYSGKSFGLGTHTISATPYPYMNLGGSPGDSLTIEFAVIDSRNNNARFTSTLIAQHSNLCVDVPGATNSVVQLQQSSCNTSNAQNYQFEPISGKRNTYQIKNRGNGLCWDISGSSVTDGTPLVQYTCTGNLNQQFVLHPVPDKSDIYFILAANSGKCIDVNGGSADSGAKLIQWTCHEGANQQWAINGIVHNNLLTNAGFESQFSGWTRYSNKESIQSDAIEGNAAYAMTTNGSGAEQSFSVTPGKPYLYAASTKSNDSGWSGFGIIYLDKNRNRIQENNAEAVTPNYFARTKIYSIAPSNAMYAKVFFWKDSADGYFYADQISVERLSEVSPDQCAVDKNSSLSGIKVTNNRSNPVKLYWIDSNCSEVYYGAINAGQTISTDAYSNVTLRIKDSSSGANLMETTVTTPWQQIVVNN